jgi:hypothetical protein
VRAAAIRQEPAPPAGGYTILSARDLTRAFPDLWASPKAAELDLQRQTPKTPLKVQIDNLIWGLRGVFGQPPHLQLTSCSYRRRNQRGPLARALLRADLPCPRAAVEALIGALAEFSLDKAAGGPAAHEPDPSPPPPPPGRGCQEASIHS